MEVDANKVINELKAVISNIVVENAMLAVQIKDLLMAAQTQTVQEVPTNDGRN